jgi:hypothetical protein
VGNIVDTLYLDRRELMIFKSSYPDAQIFNQSYSDNSVQRYRVIIPNEERSADSYYTFLVSNGIAMSSSNFIRRIAGDRKFVSRMEESIQEFADRNRDNAPPGQKEDRLKNLVQSAKEGLGPSD